jgi:hypothetical protein
MTRLKKNRLELLNDLASSPDSIAAIDELLSQIDKQRIVLTGLRAAMMKANGAMVADAVVEAESKASSEKSEHRPGNGSLTDLANSYLNDPASPYKQLRFKTREHYRGCIKRIIEDCGDRKLADLKRRDIEELDREWAKRGEAMAHALIAVLRILINYGAATLEDSECVRLSVIMRHVRFKMIKPRKTERLTADQAIAIRRVAHAKGLHSIALAQAFQFDLKLRQKDAAGEWVPMKESGTSDVMAGGRKWLHGLRWSEIDSNLILTHVSSYRQREIKFDLKRAPMVMEELAAFGDQLPTSGPIIISELHGTPWPTAEFRRKWRKAADAAGVPKHVKNTNSRTGEEREDDSENLRPRVMLK